ncbi:MULTISPECIES: hypothetical protein [Pantoea]|uniref:hypothetical protein n=1 Tax=Pantoea TaxID=53335 RepID=UPI0020BEB5CE|nr:hypothetical protein [Pantoea sp. R102]
MDYPVCTLSHRLPPRLLALRNQGAPLMVRLTQHVEQLANTTQLLQQDVAVLTARFENLATRADVERVRTEQGLMCNQLMNEIGQVEKRIDKNFERLNDRLIWTLMLPALIAVLAWFVKVAVLKI